MSVNYVIYSVVGSKKGRDPRHYMFLHNGYGYKFLALRYFNKSYIITLDRFSPERFQIFQKPHTRPILFVEIESGEISEIEKNPEIHNFDFDGIDYCYYGNSVFETLKNYTSYITKRIFNYEKDNIGEDYLFDRDQYQTLDGSCKKCVS